MPENFQITSQMILIAGAVFVLVLSVWLVGVVLMWRKGRAREDMIRERLAVMSDTHDAPRVLRLWRDGHEVTTVVAGQSFLRRIRHQLDTLPEAAGWQVPLRSIVLGLAGVMIMAATIAFGVSGSVALSISTAGVILVVFWIYTSHRVTQQVIRFEAQFVDALDLVARSLKAGHPLVGAFRLAAEEMNPPVSSLFAEIVQEQSMGVDLERSLMKAASAARGDDVKLFATSIAIQLRSGGNLAEMIDRLAAVIRDRIRLSRRVRIVTAQVQLSKRILLALPVVMFVLLSLWNPAHMEGLYKSQDGNMMLGAGIAFMLVGWWVMNQMVKIKY